MKGYDLLCISSGTLERSIAFKIAEVWKEYYGLPVLMGGPDATIEPEVIIKNQNVDAVCIGEGEHALLDFVEYYEATEKIPLNIRNFWVKCDKCHKPISPKAFKEEEKKVTEKDKEITDLKNKFDEMLARMELIEKYKGVVK